jgi:hypothetical protein
MADTPNEQAQPAGGSSPSGTATLHEVRTEVHNLQERLDELERRSSAAATPSAGGVYSDPDHPAGNPNLQDVLPHIKDLAQAVGGIKELARLVNTLAEAKG